MSLKAFIKAGPLKQRQMYIDALAQAKNPKQVSKMSVAELRALAQERDLPNYGTMKKAELIEALK